MSPNAELAPKPEPEKNMIRVWYGQMQGKLRLIWEYLNSSIHLAPYLDKKFEQIYAGDSYAFYRERFIKREK